MRLLALGAHPDDIEIYMFGTLAANRARGDDVVLAVVTDGAAGGRATPRLRRTRQAEATHVTEVEWVVPDPEPPPYSPAAVSEPPLRLRPTRAQQGRKRFQVIDGEG